MAARRTKADKVHGPHMDGSRDIVIQNEESLERQRTVFQWIFQYCLRHGLEATSEGHIFMLSCFQVHISTTCFQVVEIRVSCFQVHMFTTSRLENDASNRLNSRFD